MRTSKVVSSTEQMPRWVAGGTRIRLLIESWSERGSGMYCGRHTGTGGLLDGSSSSDVPSSIFWRNAERGARR